MKREEFYRGKRGAKYGIWNREKAVWQFDICEDTPFLAEARLHQKIGDDAKKWRFEARRPGTRWRPGAATAGTTISCIATVC